MKRVAAIVSLAFLAFLVGGFSNTGGGSAGSGTFQINMTDSPAGFDAVNIVVDSVQAHVATSDSASGWVTLNNTSGTYDLLKLTNGVNAVIGRAVVPAGHYSQIRLFIGSGSNVVVGGTSYPLNIPSGMESGLKLNVDATIQSDITYILTLDFNAAQSIVTTGGVLGGQFILKPVIHVITTPSSGAISGTISPSIALPTVTAFNSADTVSTIADTTGSFTIGYLASGSYSLQIEPSDTSFEDTTVTNINVTDGQTTKVGTITLSRH